MNLIHSLESNDANERKSASRKIWTEWDKIEDKTPVIACENLILALIEQDKGTRNVWFYMMILGLIRSKQGLKKIREEMENSSDENLRGFAAEALGHYSLEDIDDSIVELLMKLASEDTTLVVRVNSIRTLSKLYKHTREDKISQFLFTALKSQSHVGIRTMILEGIGDIGSLSIVPDLIHYMITRRLELNIKTASQTLDKIASINDYTSRKDLIRQFTKDDLENSNFEVL